MRNTNLDERVDNAASSGVRVEKTDHGWRVYQGGDDPETRFLSPSSDELARLKRKAERTYWVRKRLGRSAETA